jgi:hypothetical protein
MGAAGSAFPCGDRGAAVTTSSADRIAELEAENRFLRARLAGGPDGDLGLGLRRMEAQVLLALLERPGRYIGVEALCAGRSAATLHVHIHRLRKALAALGIAVEQRNGLGYRLDEAAARRLVVRIGGRLPAPVAVERARRALALPGDPPAGRSALAERAARERSAAE